MICDRCREGVMETRVHILDGRELCPPCYDLTLAGEERVAMKAPGA